jgi:hypothetical protein
VAGGEIGSAAEHGGVGMPIQNSANTEGQLQKIVSLLETAEALANDLQAKGLAYLIEMSVEEAETHLFILRQAK